MSEQSQIQTKQTASVNRGNFPGLRSYAPPDLERVLEFVGECCAQSDFCGCFHPGDISHFLSNSLRGADPSQHLHLYETADGRIEGLILLHPVRFSAHDLVLYPSQRGSDLETRLIEWAERATWSLVQAAASDATTVNTAVMNCDLTRQDALLRLGYQSDAAPSMMVTTLSLSTPIPASQLPEGFSIRSAAGLHEAGLLAEVHSGAFGRDWTAEQYARVMQTPGFDIERELVVVSPDGRFAAFLVYWVDPISKNGLFEPVGCHADFQRRGLTRALMYEGMRRMAARGAETAIVLHHTDNPASSGLYASVGFTPKYSLTDFRKTMQ